MIVSALSLGAGAALKATVESAVKDAYAGLKGLVLRKLGKQGEVAGAVDAVEKKPESAGHKQVLQEELTAAGAGCDQEVVDKATELLKLMESKSPGITGGLVGQINAAGGKVAVVGTNTGTFNM